MLDAMPKCLCCVCLLCVSMRRITSFVPSSAFKCRSWSVDATWTHAVFGELDSRNAFPRCRLLAAAAAAASSSAALSHPSPAQPAVTTVGLSARIFYALQSAIAKGNCHVVNAFVTASAAGLPANGHKLFVSFRFVSFCWPNQHTKHVCGFLNNLPVPNFL